MPWKKTRKKERGDPMSERFQVVVDPMLEPVMDRYFEIRYDELDQMEQALAEDDAEVIALLGHRLKGSGSSYGFVRLTELGAVIEAAAREGKLENARNPLAEVRRYLDAVDVVYGEQA